MTENLSIKSDKKSILRNLLVTLEDFLKSSKNNAETELSEQFFTDLKVLLETNEFNCEGKNLLDSNVVNSAIVSTRPIIEKLFYSLRAMEGAHCEAAREQKQNQSGNKDQDLNPTASVVIHNREIAERLAADYNSQSFARIFDFCRSKGVFSLKINETTGLVATAEAEENWDMSGRQWVTDTVRCGDIERVVAPQAWRKAMLTLCDFYRSPKEVEAIEKSVADPNYYRQGGLLDGVAHIFIPHTLDRDETWFNNKRLESHGLALKAICDTVIHRDESWAFSAEELAENRSKIANVIVSLASYLKSINSRHDGYFDFAAPSAGPWEEIPFPEGLTWDTEAIRSGFESLHNLLNNPRWQAQKDVSEMRLAINAEPMADWLQPESEALPNLLRLARGKIIDRLFGQAEPVENPHRPMDCSLAFITTSSIALADDIVEDVQLHLKVLQALEKNLVRPHGIVRYAPFSLPMPEGSQEKGDKEEVFDSYLADNYWLLPELRAHLSGLGKGQTRDWGSGDCSSHEDYVSRVKLARPGTEAQWCFVSVMAEGYLRQAEKLLRFGEAKSQLELLSYTMAKGSEYLNRSFARITPAKNTAGETQSADLKYSLGEAIIKANGRDCPAWSIPEAYEMVSSDFSEGDRTELAALPGANTPLAWGQSSLFSACFLMEKLLPQVEELKP